MRKRLTAISFTLLVSLQILAPALAANDDWVEDDKVQGFYKRGVKNVPEDYNGPPGQRDSDSVPYNQLPIDELGGLGNPSESDLWNQMPNQRPIGQGATQQLQPQDRGFLGKARSFGKSVINAPKNLLMGTDELLDDPGFWQSAGAVAGMGANAYMNYRFMRNNPYYGAYNPYLGGLYPGYGGVPFGAVNPGLGFNYYNPYGGVYGNPYGFGTGLLGNPYGLGFGMNPYYGGGNMYTSPWGMGNPANPFARPTPNSTFQGINPGAYRTPGGFVSK